MILREKILRYLKKSKRNTLTVTEASEMFDVTRQAAYLALLKLFEKEQVAVKDVTKKRVGRPAQLWAAR